MNAYYVVVAASVGFLFAAVAVSESVRRAKARRSRRDHPASKP